MYDIAIIGGGPGGYAAALKAAKLGGKVLLCEETALGGTCLNVGCIPTKSLLSVAHLVESIRSGAQDGLIRDAGRVSFRKAQARKQAAVAQLVGGVGQLLKASGVTVVNARASFSAPGVVEAGGQRYQARNVVLATGSAPSMPPIPGIERALDSTGALALDRPPRTLAIIGGGVIGLEFASLFAAFHTRVTVVEMLPQLLPGEDPAMAAQLRRRMEAKGIAFLTGAKVLRIEPEALIVAGEGGERAVPCDVVLCAAGRRPQLPGIDVGALGLTLTERGFVQVDAGQRTNLPGVFAIGDVAGGWQLAHAAYAEAETAAVNALGGSAATDVAAMPRCIYTLPNFAAVGLTPQAAEKAGLETDAGSFPYAANGRALAEGQGEGLVKTLAERGTGRILGVSILGENAAELIGSACTAISLGATVADWERIIMPHPSYSEMIKESALAAHKQALHIL